MYPLDVSKLLRSGHIYVEYPHTLRQRVCEASEDWRAFCALPDDLKSRFPYTNDVNVSGNGYELKRDGKTGDLKEDFHLRVEAREWLLSNAQDISPVAVSFVKSALAIRDEMEVVIRAFVEAAECQFDMPNFAKDVLSRKDAWLLRFLHYFGECEVGESLAAPHVDKGGFTLHLQESCGGVEYLDYVERVWKPLPLTPRQTVIFPGMGSQHRSKCTVRALAHRVVATEESARDGRYSAVGFFDAAHGGYYNKEVYGRLQDHDPAAFYDIPFPEFDTFFTNER